MMRQLLYIDLLRRTTRVEYVSSVLPLRHPSRPLAILDNVVETLSPTWSSA